MYCQLLAWLGPMFQCNCYRPSVQCLWSALPATPSSSRHADTERPRNRAGGRDAAVPALVLGLGNPGKRYEKTRHNVGAMLLEALLSDSSAFKGWRRSDGAWVAAGTLGAAAVLLAQPMTPMNLSGENPHSTCREPNRRPLSLTRIVCMVCRTGCGRACAAVQPAFLSHPGRARRPRSRSRSC